MYLVLGVVVVVLLGYGKQGERTQRKVVAAVCVDGLQNSEHSPHIHCPHMSAHQQRPCVLVCDGSIEGQDGLMRCGGGC